MLARHLLGQGQPQPAAFRAAADQRQEHLFGEFGAPAAVVDDFRAATPNVVA